MSDETVSDETVSDETVSDETVSDETVSDRANGQILLLSGPNLNLLGERQPEIYGHQSLEDLVSIATETAAANGFGLKHHQSNHEGELVDAIHAAREANVAIVINPGALTHYGWSLHDALAAFDGPVIELHLSNPNAREPWRHVSVVAPVATGSIVGFGQYGYRLAIEAVAALVAVER